MAKYFTDFSENPVQSGVPAGWTQKVKAVSGDSINIANDATMGRVMKLNKSGTSGSFIISNNNLNGVSDLETLSLFKVEDTGQNGQFGINYNRFTGTSESTTNGMRTSLVPVSSVPSLVIADASVGVQQYTNFSWNLHTWYWARFRTVGTEIKSKVWAYGTPEPANWNLDLSYSKTLSNPYSGVGTYVQNNSVVYAQYSAGTGGDEAPITTYNDTGWVSAGSISGGTSTVCDDFDFSELPDNISVKGIELHIIAEGAIDTFSNVTLSSPAVDSASIAVSNPGATVTYSFGRYDDSWGASWNKSDIENLAVTINSVNKQLFVYDAKVRVYYEVVENTPELTKIGEFVSPTSTGNFDITNVGFEPTGVIIFETSIKDSYMNISSGFSDADGNQASASMVAISRFAGGSYRESSNTEIIYRKSTDGTTVIAASFVKSLPNGFRLNFRTATNANRFKYIAFRDVPIKVGHINTNNATSSVTNMGFKPKAMMGIWRHSDIANNATFGVGWVDQYGTQRGSVGNNNSSGSGYAYEASFVPVYAAAGAAFAGRLKVDSMDNDGFTYTTSSSYEYSYFAIGGVNSKLYEIIGPTSSGTHSHTGVGFKPNTLMNTGMYRNASNPLSPYTSGWGLATYTGFVDSSENQFFVGAAGWNGSNNSMTRYYNDSKGFGRTSFGSPSPSGHIEGEFKSFDSDGFTIDWNNVESANMLWATMALAKEEISLGSVSSSVHSLDSSSPILTQSHNLGIGNAYHSHSSDGSPVLSQKNVLSINNTLHTLLSGTPSLTQGFSAVVNNTTHATNSDNITLIQTHILNTNNTLHSHTVDGDLSIVQAFGLAVDGATHSLTSSSPVLVMAAGVAVQSASHSVVSDNITLAQINTLSVDSTLHSTYSDSLLLAQSNALTVDNTIHSIVSDVLTLVEQRNITVQSSVHSVKSDNVSVIQGHTLTTNNTLHGLGSDTVSILQSNRLLVSNTLHSTTSSVIDIIQYTLLGVPDSSSHGVRSEELWLAQNNILDINSAINRLSSSNIKIINWDELGVGFGLYRSEYIHSGRLTGRNIQGYVQTDTYIPEYKQLGRLGLPKDEPTGRFVQKNITRGAL